MKVMTPRTPIHHAVTLLLLGVSSSAVLAQQAASQQLETVVVTGIRASQEKSIALKRNSDARVDVISAEDIGKMPDKNVADSLARIPGVNVSNAVAGEGGFDERDRVGLRGTNPSLTQTLVNGHGIANGDWFVLSQTGAGVGRSVSYSLLPSELVDRVVLRKSSEASLVEGGTAGSVDIITRSPLQFRQAFTAEVQAGIVHSTLAEKTDPQFSALINFKNDAKTFGVMLQVFSETRHLRRDGIETLSYDKIAADSPLALADPKLANVFYPRAIGAALFQQERKRNGGLISVELKPSDDLSLNLSGFTSKLDAANYNNNYLLMGGNILNGGKGQAPDAGYVVATTGGVKTLVQANFKAVPGNAYGEIDPISRPDSSASSNFVNLDATWKASSALKLSAKLGSSTGVGKTGTQDVVQLNVNSSGAGWKLNGAGSAPAFNLGTQNAATSKGTEFGWEWGSQNIRVRDKEDWLHLDGEYTLDAGVLASVKFGVRAAKHDRRTMDPIIGQGPACADTKVVDWTGTYNCKNDAASPFNPVNLPAQGQNYPGNFGSGLGSGFPTGIAYYTPEQLATFNAKFARRDLPGRRDWTQDYKVVETTQAGYVQANLEDKGWSGNVGLRVVKTKSTAGFNIPASAGVPGFNGDSAFGGFAPVEVERSYTDALPSASFKFDLNKDSLIRVSASKTITRADYTALAGAVSLTPPKTLNETGSGSSGNPALKPIRSTNLDLNYEWYFAPRAFASAGVFLMDMKGYVTDGSFTAQYVTNKPNSQETYLANYLLTGPVNTDAKVKGVELAFETPLLGDFGVNANYTYADAKEANGHALKGAARHNINVGGFYESGPISLRVSYGWRGDMYVGQDRGYDFQQKAGGVLSASLAYKINEQFSVSLDGQNLNDPTLKYFGANQDQPRSIYKNGRQYYLTARAKF